MKRKALIVDDEPDIRRLLAITLNRMDLETFQAETVAQAHRLLGEHPFELCLTDMRLPDGDGIELVEHIQHTQPELPVAVITAYGNVDSAVRSLKAGAFDFISKPVKLDSLRQVVAAALKQPVSEEQDSGERLGHSLLGNSATMRRLRTLITKVARSQSPVYVHGSTGTGKELVARLIHDSSGRREGPWIPVNCGAVPHELMESEFFGHKRGSFTGAHQDKQGLFEAASGGTLFLDEVADLPLAMQVKLLRAIQERKVKPVGGATEIPVDVRIISASHASLTELVRHGSFRNDLFYRLNVIQLDVPDLRDRKEDIPELTGQILRRLNHNASGGQVSLSDSAMQCLLEYDFPGNVRELENILERAYTLCESDIIEDEDMLLDSDVQMQDALNDNYEPGSVPLDDHLASVEKQAILDALMKTDGNKTAAAELLGMSFRQMRYKLKKYHL